MAAECVYSPTMNFPLHEPHWVNEAQLSLLQPNPIVRQQLLSNGSLTKTIIQHCSGRFRVEVVRQGFTPIHQSERELLGLRGGATANTRDVLLHCSEPPWVFAHTVIPHYALHRALRRLTQLGNRSLGAVLHSSRKMSRDVVQYARFHPQHWLFQQATANLSTPPTHLWGRRILYRIDGDPLLVNELFLPQFNQ